ncbi:putative GTP pyrophosphokinase [Granulicatella balaenopterae]|uniref:Putative GTP pyrophosphokinase n=1 Tax=Granulicatella balaenopterae TaxID=137733 RepID=A0A1H9MMV8_9LACT|nr:GTP pyrophosphokinase family protein [Granulicatella balaenopterae]SER24785.1 putative GTP pyrophosphokinase [Granulicatella balaenopterae]
MEKTNQTLVENWDAFLAPYYQAVEELKIKLKGIRKQYRQEGRHAPIEFITGRVKTPESILEKMEVRNIPEEEFLEGVQDVAGLRVMCQFVEDIYEVVRLLHQRKDFNILIERDYIHNKKKSGYRSYHVVIEYPVQRIEGEQKILVEIQIRTLAMNFWATIEHSLNYKYKGEYPEEIHERLERAAEAAFLLDEEMSQIREEIQEAQFMFSKNKVFLNSRTYEDRY